MGDEGEEREVTPLEEALRCNAAAAREVERRCKALRVLLLKP